MHLDWHRPPCERRGQCEFGLLGYKEAGDDQSRKLHPSRSDLGDAICHTSSLTPGLLDKATPNCA